MTALKTIADWMTQYGVRSTPQTRRVWLTLSLGFAVLYGVLFWQIAFEGPYAIQDDARQHVFWMLRYVDPALFPNDIVTDYFQSVAPAGYKALYRLGALLGIHPFTLSKLLPPLISLVGTVYGFYLCLAILPVPLVAFVNTLILNQSLWMWDELASATPKAFSVLVIIVFLFYVAERRLWGCAIAIMLQGLFYPHMVFISVLVLALRFLWPQANRKESLQFLIVGTIAAVIVLLPYALATSPYGPVVTLEQAKTMAEFQPGGRNTFFYDSWSKYWLFSGRSGFLPPVVPVTVCLAPLLPVLLWLRLPLISRMTRNSWLIVQLGMALTIMFFLSHGVLFRLHLPSRYSRHPLKVIVALTAAIVLVALVHAGLSRLLRRASPQPWRQLTALAMVAGLAMITVGYPLLLNSFLNVVYIKSDRVALYEYLQQQPKDIRIASLTREAENLPAFTGRSILFSRGHSLAYHQGYYDQIRPRILDVIAGQFTPDLSVLKSVITNYDIDFWLVDENSFNFEALQNQWLSQFRTEWETALNQLQQQPSSLQRLQPVCTAISEQGKTLISAQCILETE